MLKEFRNFIARGNVIDLAVGIIIGSAFTAIVSSLVDDLINPLLGLIVGGIDFSGISFGLGQAQFRIGNFINAVIKFLLIAWVVFLLVKGVTSLRLLAEPKAPKAPTPAAPPAPTEAELLAEIRDLLRERLSS